MHSKLLIVILFISLLTSCINNYDEYYKHVDLTFENVSSITFKFEIPYGNEVTITNPDKIQKIKNWLKNSKPLKDMGSYPDSLVPVLILSNSDKKFKFKVSQPIRTLDYTIISWDKYVLVAEKIPSFVLKGATKMM